MLIMKYIAWHYSQGVKKLLEIWKNFLAFFWQFFSVGILFRTLFFPWKRDINFAAERGLHPFLFFQRHLNNVFSRLMGGIVRLTVIVIGFAAEAVTLILGIASLILWITLPVALVFSLLTFFSLFDGTARSSLYEIMIGDILFFSAWLFVVSLHSFAISTDRNWQEKNLEDLARDKWFGRVWNRMGFLQADEDFIKAFSDKPSLQNKLNHIGLNLESFSEIIAWEGTKQEREENKYKFWNWENLIAIDPIGREWAYAYTVELDRHSHELPEKSTATYKKSYLMGHKKDIDMAELILSRPSQNNILLVGEPGVGKRTLVNLLAKKIREQRNDSLLKNKRLVELDLAQVIAESDEKSLASRLHKIFQEALIAGNIILIIDNIHEFLSSNNGKGNADISSILVKYLPYPTFQILGTINTQAFHEHVEKNAGFMKYVEKIIIGEPSKKETKFAMLQTLALEEKSKVFVSYQAIEEIVELSDQYVTDAPMPEKAIDILEEVLIFWFKKPDDRFLSKDDVDNFFSEKTKIPLGRISEKEKDTLINLEEILHQRIIGQDEAVKQIAEAVRRTRAGISDSGKPKGSFLFLGPTGVGKTETAKALAAAYFGSEDKMIRLDMSEFQTADSVDRLLGSQNSGKPGQLITKVTENPFSVLLLDEIEKAYPDILNLFLQVLDEGWLTDAFGKKILFKNMIIVATSNAGSAIIKEEIEKGKSSEEIYAEIIDHVTKEGVFKTEFLNRFEKIIFFKSLEQDQLRSVISIMLKKITDNIYKKKNITVEFGEDVTDEIISKGYNPIFGARSIKHFMQDRIEDVLAKKIIAQEISEGNKIRLEAVDMR